MKMQEETEAIRQHCGADPQKERDRLKSGIPMKNDKEVKHAGYSQR